jgi:alcohol dehydrogenase class IV
MRSKIALPMTASVKMTLPKANWNYPTAVRFGAGRIAELADACTAAGISRPLLVTDPFLARQPMTANALALLNDAGLGAAVFSDIKANPVETNVYKGLEAMRGGGHDGVVAFGGGSALDVGKVIAFMMGQTRPMWDFEDVGDWWTRADPKGIAPVVAIPTTAGTGAEVGRAGVITQEATHTKKVIFHPLMMPKVTICDPELTLGMPPQITAGTGLDALAHCLEAYCAPSYHPLADGIAVEGMRLVKEYLPRAYRNGQDLEARAYMMSAAAMGATAFQKGLGAIHALSHPAGALYDTHHGLTNAVFMPYVLVYNREAITPKVERLAAYLGLRASFQAFLDWVLALRRELAVPHTLQGLKIGPERFAEMAAMAPQDPTAGGNPVPITATDARRLYENALEGRL